MPYEENQPLLMEIFAELTLEFAWLSVVTPPELTVLKRVSDKRYITTYHYSHTLGIQYEIGALLGRAMLGKLEIFLKMLVKPKTDINRSVAFIQSEAKDRLKRFTEEKGKEPDTFHDFITYRVLEEKAKVMGLPMKLSADDNVYTSRLHTEDVWKLWGHELALDDVYKNIINCGLHGLGFGTNFPELTIRMYKNVYEITDINILKQWAEGRSHGLNLPEKPDFIPLEEREKTLLSMVATYTAKFYPELLDSLDLRIA